MPTQRSFLSNFLAAFRAHSAIQHGKATSSPSSSHTQPHTQSASPHNSSPSQPRSIATKAGSGGAGATSNALSTLHSPRGHGPGSRSTSPGAPSPNNNSYETSQNQAPYGPHLPNHQNQHSQSQAHTHTQARYISSPNRNRRGSDSSSEGFRDVLGKEKWYIGGRTAGGEEKYFKLGVVRRVRSGDRLSLDRLSL